MGWSTSVSVTQISPRPGPQTSPQLVDLVIVPNNFNLHGSSQLFPLWINVTISGSHTPLDLSGFFFFYGPAAIGPAELLLPFGQTVSNVGSNTLFARELLLEDYVDWPGTYHLKGIILESLTLTQQGESVRIIGNCPQFMAELYGYACGLSAAHSLRVVAPVLLLPMFLFSFLAM